MYEWKRMAVNSEQESSLLFRQEIGPHSHQCPSLVEEMLEALRRLSIESRRLIGLAVLATGVALLWFAAFLGVLG